MVPLGPPTRRGHKRGRHQGFHPLVNLPFPMRARRNLQSWDFAKERAYCSSSMGAHGVRPFLDLSRSSCFRTATQTGYSPQSWHDRAAQLFNALYRMAPEFRHLVQFIFAGAVYHNALTTCATLLCRACVEVNHMCSRTVSNPANGLLKRTYSEGSSSVAEKNPLPFPYFAAVTCRQSAPDYQGKGDSQEGGNRRCLPSCARAASAHSR